VTWLISKALLEDFENSRYSPGVVEESSAASYSDGERSAQLNVMLTHHPFWLNDKMMDALSLSRFGQTCAVLTDDHGAELLTWYLADIHARTCPQPGEGKESQEHEADCGQKWRGLLAKYDHDTRSWKTAQCSLLGDLEQSLETWPRSGLMRTGACYQRQPLGQNICAKESGFSPDGVTTFHTPTTQGMNGGSNSRRALKKRMWTTPSASDAKRGGTITDNMTGTSLVQQVNTSAYWPTPTVVCGNYNRKGVSSTSGDGMATAVKMWPTPTANDSKNSTLPESQRNRDGMAGSLLRQGHQPGETLNPEWVEWLMNWPIGWTSLEPMKPENWERWKASNARQHCARRY